MGVYGVGGEGGGVVREGGGVHSRIFVGRNFLHIFHNILILQIIRQ